MAEQTETIFLYNIKCRGCGNIETMYFGSEKTSRTKDFTMWAAEHSTFPTEHECSCNNEMTMFHDIIGYGFKDNGRR